MNKKINAQVIEREKEYFSFYFDSPLTLVMFNSLMQITKGSTNIDT